MPIKSTLERLCWGHCHVKNTKMTAGSVLKKIVTQNFSVHKVKASHESCKNQKERHLSYSFELFNALIFEVD